MHYSYKAGVELYSWQDAGEWSFALLDVTNNAKPDGDIKAAAVNLPQLEAAFAGYAEGEHIFWYVARFQRPDAAIMQKVQAAAQSHRLILRTVE